MTEKEKVEKEKSSDTCDSQIGEKRDDEEQLSAENDDGGVIITEPAAVDAQSSSTDGATAMEDAKSGIQLLEPKSEPSESSEVRDLVVSPVSLSCL